VNHIVNKRSNYSNILNHLPRQRRINTSSVVLESFFLFFSHQFFTSIKQLNSQVRKTAFGFTAFQRSLLHLLQLTVHLPGIFYPTWKTNGARKQELFMSKLHAGLSLEEIEVEMTRITGKRFTKAMIQAHMDNNKGEIFTRLGIEPPTSKVHHQASQPAFAPFQNSQVPTATHPPATRDDWGNEWSEIAKANFLVLICDSNGFALDGQALYTEADIADKMTATASKNNWKPIKVFTFHMIRNYISQHRREIKAEVEKRQAARGPFVLENPGRFYAEHPASSTDLSKLSSTPIRRWVLEKPEPADLTDPTSSSAWTKKENELFMSLAHRMRAFVGNRGELTVR